MKPNTVGVSSAVDRLATTDEIRAATISFLGPIEIGECVTEIPYEAASDLGGYIRLPVLEFEILRILEELASEQGARAD